MRFIGFIGPSYKLNSVNVDCQRCVNLYPELNEIGTGKEHEVAALVSTPGLGLLVNLNAGPVRGLFTATTGFLYAVSLNKLYRISSTFVATEIGTLNTSSGQISMVDNGITLFVVDGTYGYTHVLTSSTLELVVDPKWRGAEQIAYQDGYFIFAKPNSQSFYISGLTDTTFDGDDVGESDGSPDNITSILCDHRELWIFNTRSTEVYYNAGRTTTLADGTPSGFFPFERIDGAYLEHGCGARFSTAKINNTVFWLGQDDKGNGIIYQAQGYRPQRISTHAVELAIQSYGDVSGAVAYTYQENGHSFYCINFSQANTTWVFDTTTNLWHERAYSSSGQLQRHRGNCHAFAYSKHIVGDYENGNLYEQSTSIYSDNGREITRRRVAPHITQDLQRIFYSSFQLDLETGTGIDGLGQGVDPQVILQFSDDGGHSWSNEKWASFGAIGVRNKRAIWRRLGSARDRVFSITITDPVKVTIIGAELDMNPGAN